MCEMKFVKIDFYLPSHRAYVIIACHTTIRCSGQVKTADVIQHIITDIEKIEWQYSQIITQFSAQKIISHGKIT